MKHSSFIFTENYVESHIFIEEEDNPSNKVVTVAQELDSIDIDCIGNLVDLPRVMLSMKNVGIL